MNTTEQDTTHGNVRKTDNMPSITDEELRAKNPKNTELIEQIPVEDTPFTAVRYDKDWFLTLGKYRLTEKLNTKEEAIEDAKRADWWRVMQIMNIMIDERKNEIKKETIKEIVEDHTIQENPNQIKLKL